MKRRKNAVYTGKSKHASTDTGGYRVLVDAFYKKLNEVLRPEDEIEIIPPEQVNPTSNFQEQAYTVADYCVRKLLPELTDMFRWGAQVTAELRALAPIGNNNNREEAEFVVGGLVRNVVRKAAYEAQRIAGTDEEVAFRVPVVVDYIYIYVLPATNHPRDVGTYAAECAYNALVACIEAGDEAAYNRIIALTNEMLESL